MMSNSNAFEEGNNSGDKASSCAEMPPVLRGLVTHIDAIAAGADATNGSDGRGNKIQNDELPPSPVATVELLRQIDDLYETYTRLVEVVYRSLAPTAAPSSGDPTDVEQADVIIRELKGRVGALQAGIRSKVHQVGRFALINHLNLEVQQRQAAVARMESVLATTRRHI
ncbi:unnamed protein product [Phytomonas sp. EM1]|nr:unnamed protein product [Phytomonas sp. EM1]|eukprot:CCW60450.1 unnamed protein product [Phytomonas sp. isolate EM1]